MRTKADAHRHGRSTGRFEEHRRSRASVHKRSLWRIYDAERGWTEWTGAHFRMTARAAALDAKHMRSAEEPARAGHL